MTKGAVIGMPIQVMARIVSGGMNLGGLVGGRAGTLIAAGTVAATAIGVGAKVATGIAPHINSMFSNDANRDASDLGAITKEIIKELVTFMDLNAQVIKIGEKRRIAVIDVPGREGDYIQNLGGKSATYTVSGKFYRSDPKDGTSQSPFSGVFRTMFDNVAVGQAQLMTLLVRTGVPVPFMCEYGMAEVIIRNFDTEVPQGQPEYINYTIDMIEYRRLPTLLKMIGLAALGVVDK